LDTDAILSLINSGGMLALLLIAVKLGLKGDIVSRAMLREVVRIVIEELQESEKHEHPPFP